MECKRDKKITDHKAIGVNYFQEELEIGLMESEIYIVEYALNLVATNIVLMAGYIRENIKL